MPETPRPNPDLLLRQVSAQEAKQARAKLKVFFGFAPGVGKTYRMLQAARDLVAEQRIDLVVGLVETHKRYETAAMVIGLELLARRKSVHRGISIEEFDLDAALARKPQVILVDELAHTNAPGSRHPKRWQDILELLDAGIEVHTTVNVQHIESLNDVVAQITGIRVRETVPDAVLERADEVELIDVSPEELRARLKEGKIYLGQQAERAADKFFTQGNLLALRELALRQVAHYVDKDVLDFRHQHGVQATWESSERILVCITPAAQAAQLIRAAKRMATRLRCPWAVANVDASTIRPLADQEQGMLESHFAFAQSLGGTVVRLTGSNVAQAILQHARTANVTRIIVSKPRRTSSWHRLCDRLRGSLLDDLVTDSGTIDIHVITSMDVEPRQLSGDAPAEQPVALGAYVSSVALVAMITAIAGAVRALMPVPDLEMLYFMGVIVAGVMWGRGPAMLTAALSVAAYDFFFVPPLHAFAVADGRYILTFALMFCIGLIVSELVTRLKRQELQAIVRERRTARLYATNRELSDAPNVVAAATTIVTAAADVFAGNAYILRLADDGECLDVAATPSTATLTQKERSVAEWSLKHHTSAGLGTDTLNASAVLCVPIGDAEQDRYVLALAPYDHTPLRSEQRDFLDAFVRQAAIAIDRLRLSDEARQAAISAQTEEMRSTLLSTVSHDLRTPLATITGAATSLRADHHLPETTKRELVDAICEQADKMDRLIANLLNMTRLETGGLSLALAWVPLEEIIGSALDQLDTKLGDRPISIDIDTAVPFVAVDPVLFEQVFVNLFENANKYSPAGTPLEIRARLASSFIEIDVMDRGPGLVPGSEHTVFNKFYRGDHTQVAHITGAGLGLTICRGIAVVHGGTIEAQNRDGGGAIFRIRLPVKVPPTDIKLSPTATMVMS